MKIIIEQAIVIRELQTTIKELKQEIERLHVSSDLDSKSSSKPPSTHLLKKTEKKKPEIEHQSDSPKRKPGGPGRTHLNFIPNFNMICHGKRILNSIDKQVRNCCDCGHCCGRCQVTI